MDSIMQIAHLLDGYKLANIDIIDNDDSKSRFTEFYRLIKDGTLTTDEVAARHFYPDPKGRELNYRKFKSQFNERLINTVFFLDIHNKKASEHQNAVAEAEKTWAATIILYNRGAIDAAIELSEKLLKHCIYYELTELVVQITDKLKHMYGTVTGNFNRYDYLQEIHWQYVGFYMAELKAKNLFQSIRMPYIKSAAYNSSMYEVADKAVQELEPLRQNCSTYMFMSFCYYINLAKYQTIFDQRNAIKMCEEGIAYFRQKPYAAHAPLIVLLNQKLICQIQLRLYDAGKMTAREVLTLHVDGTRNWYKTLEQHMMLAFHTQEYADAYEVYKMAVNHRDFRFLKAADLEIWLLYEAYLCLVVKMGKIQNVIFETSHFKNFKLSKFINNISQFSGDKKGMNIPMLIVQYLLQLTEKDRGQLIDRIDAMEQYVKRHIKGEETAQRVNCFLKLLLELSKVHYSKKLIASKAKALMSEISGITLDIMEQGDRIEIMPFEYLWEEMQPFLRP
jgi:hypothetical protein